MSASEKLKRLDRSAAGDRVISVFRKTGPKLAGFDAFTRAEDLEELRNALPQIVALTEAVEDYVSIPLSRGFALSTAPLRDALAALDEALQ